MNVTDSELNARLLEVLGFEPWDRFAHVRKQLRRGRTYLVIRRGGPSYKDTVRFIDCLAIQLPRVIASNS
jgi:hypothetical protein